MNILMIAAVLITTMELEAWKTTFVQHIRPRLSVADGRSARSAGATALRCRRHTPVGV